jgi:hypothetical protein
VRREPELLKLAVELGDLAIEVLDGRASERNASLAACEGWSRSLSAGRSLRHSEALARIDLRTASCSRSCCGTVIISFDSWTNATLRAFTALARVTRTSPIDSTMPSV